MKNNVTIISGSSNLELAENISKNLGIKLTPVEIKRFNDGEIYTKIGESVRGSSVFIIQSTSSPVNDNLMELLMMVDALKRASAKEITAVIPYYGYARQDRKSTSREPITAKLVASLLETAGVDRVVTIDLHVDQIQGFFDVPVDNLMAMPILAQVIMDKKLDNLVVVAPDAGGVTRARRLADILLSDIALIHKKRTVHGKSEIFNLVGEVAGKTAILIDDMIDTGGTIVNAAKELKKQGAKEVYICVTHPVFSNNAVEKLNCNEVDEVIVTDTIKLKDGVDVSKIKVVSLAPFLAEIIDCIIQGAPMGKIVEEKYNPVFL